MAGPPELLNFVNKFLNLLNCGQSARLTVESQGGNATVNLQLNLEPCPPHVESQLEGRHRRHAGPSRLRRHAARAQARQQAAAEAATYAEAAARATISSTSTTIATAAKAGADPTVAEEATKDTNENAKINPSTEEVSVAEKYATTEEAAAKKTIGISERRFKDDIKKRDDTIEELKEKVSNLYKENLELKEKNMVTQMFYDGFRDEMREKFGYDSDEDAEEQRKVGTGKVLM